MHMFLIHSIFHSHVVNSLKVNHAQDSLSLHSGGLMKFTNQEWNPSRSLCNTQDTFKLGIHILEISLDIIFKSGVRRSFYPNAKGPSPINHPSWNLYGETHGTWQSHQNHTSFTTMTINWILRNTKMIFQFHPSLEPN